MRTMLLTVIFALASACSGGSPEVPETAEVLVEGTWKVLRTALTPGSEPECTSVIFRNENLTQITQSDTSIVIDWPGTPLVGELNGLTLTTSESPPVATGTATLDHAIEFSADGTSFTGLITFAWTNGTKTCARQWFVGGDFITH